MNKWFYKKQNQNCPFLLLLVLQKKRAQSFEWLAIVLHNNNNNIRDRRELKHVLSLLPPRGGGGGRSNILSMLFVGLDGCTAKTKLLSIPHMGQSGVQRLCVKSVGANGEEGIARAIPPLTFAFHWSNKSTQGMGCCCGSGRLL